jgi:hypothetical protein
MYRELIEKLEEAKKELDRAYVTDDWDYIMACSIDVYILQRQIEAIV